MKHVRAFSGLLSRAPLLALVVLVSVTGSAHAKPNKVCRQCRVQCRESLPACIAGDPRVAMCPEKRQKTCLRRAKRDCKRNLRTCCSQYCQDTGLVACCGSATSNVPPSRGGPTTSTLPGGGGGGGTTTTTLPPGATACSSDADCPTCQCCNLVSGVCGGVTGSGAGNCCNLPGTPPASLFGACGPKTPDPCPASTMCIPGTQIGETRYHCGYCAGSNNIVEVFTMSGAIPPISQPSNACMRR
jgi:hypothetical protein